MKFPLMIRARFPGDLNSLKRDSSQEIDRNRTSTTLPDGKIAAAKKK
jgi:hypothetical protein